MFDVIIIGAGIVGAASALKLKNEYPDKRILVLEKESTAACHQTGRNSGVIHAGVYYAPGSLKAQYCREGLERTISYCEKFNLPYLQCGKLLVATSEIEEQRMAALYERCSANELNPVMLSKQQLELKEPNIRGLSAFFVEQTGIVDYTKLTNHLLFQFQELGGEVRYQEQVIGLDEDNNGVAVQTKTTNYETQLLINCAGLHADKIIKLTGLKTDFEIVPFKGEYYLLAKKHNEVVNHLIYPIPDPELPFLGVHLTRMIDGTVTVGPSAVLAFGREAYGKHQVNFADTLEMLKFPGFYKVLKNNFRSGINEFKNSISKSGYLKLVNKYCPSVAVEDLLPYPAGIRAQAVTNSGELVHDFKFVESARCLHIGNAPSPAATSAMPIADAIYRKIRDKL